MILHAASELASHAFLAAGGDFAQLIFLVIAFVVWVLTEGARQRKEKAKQKAAEGRPPAPKPVHTSRHPQPLAPDPVPQRTRHVPAGRSAPRAPEPTARERARELFKEVLGLPSEPVLEPQTEPERPAPRAAPAPRAIPRPPTRAIQPVTNTQPEASEPAQVAHRPSRTRMLMRLGIVPGRPAREAARRAVLWNEILGPPRALRGPHRPPRRR